MSAETPRESITDAGVGTDTSEADSGGSVDMRRQSGCPCAALHDLGQQLRAERKRREELDMFITEIRTVAGLKDERSSTVLAVIRELIDTRRTA